MERLLKDMDFVSLQKADVHDTEVARQVDTGKDMDFAKFAEKSKALIDTEVARQVDAEKLKPSLAAHSKTFMKVVNLIAGIGSMVQTAKNMKRKQERPQRTMAGGATSSFKIGSDPATQLVQIRSRFPSQSGRRPNLCLMTRA